MIEIDIMDESSCSSPWLEEMIRTSGALELIANWGIAKNIVEDTELVPMMVIIRQAM